MPAFAFPFASPFGGPVVGLSSPVRPPGFLPSAPASKDLGVDVSCAADLDPTFSLVTGNRALAECLARRLQTPRGSLEYAPSFGTDLRGYLNAAFDARQLAQLKADVEGECERDQRVKSAAATVSYIQASQTLKIDVVISTADGPFTLTLAVSALGVSLLREGT